MTPVVVFGLMNDKYDEASVLIVFRSFFFDLSEDDTPGKVVMTQREKQKKNEG